MTPHAGKAVGLQLHFHRQAIRFSLRRVLLQLTHFGFNTQQLLHVMPDFMSNHVGLCKIAVRAELVFHLIVEREIDVDRAIGRAVERPHHRLAGTAAGPRRAAIEHQLRLRVLTAHFLEDGAPGVFGIRKDHLSELRGLLFLRADGALGGGLLL